MNSHVESYFGPVVITKIGKRLEIGFITTSPCWISLYLCWLRSAGESSGKKEDGTQKQS